MFKFFRARMSGWLLVTLLLVAAIAVTAPKLLPVSLYKLSLITSAAWVAYWIDRSLFPYARPDSFIVKIEPKGESCDIDLDGDCKLIPWEVIDGDGFVFAMAMLRRAIIVGCAMMAIGLGA